MSEPNKKDLECAALKLAADEWDYATEHGLHEVGIPVSEILRDIQRRLAREAT